MNTLRFIVADDNPVDKFLHAKIVSELGHQVVDLVDDGIALVEACRLHHPDMVLCDTVMPKLDGISACAEIKKENPHIKFICATSFADLSFPIQLKKAGVNACVIKGFTALKLNSILEQVRAQKFYIDPLMHNNLVESLKIIRTQLTELSEATDLAELKELADLSSHHIIEHNGERLKITDRHVLLVSAIYHNMKREDIAQLMNVSIEAVDMNIKRIKHKMGVDSKLELIKLFEEWSLIQPINKKKR